MHWFRLEWWQYLLSPRASHRISWLVVLYCRIRNHPHGSGWYNVGGVYPDTRCQDCGDDLG